MANGGSLMAHDGYWWLKSKGLLQISAGTASKAYQSWHAPDKDCSTVSMQLDNQTIINMTQFSLLCVHAGMGFSTAINMVHTRVFDLHLPVTLWIFVFRQPFRHFWIFWVIYHWQLRSCWGFGPTDLALRSFLECILALTWHSCLNCLNSKSQK